MSFHAHKSNNAVCCSVCSLAILSVLRRSGSAKYTKKGYGYRKIQKAYAWCTELGVSVVLQNSPRHSKRAKKRLTWTVSSESQAQTPLTCSNEPPRLFRIIDTASTLCFLFPLLATANHYAGSTVFLFQAPPFDSSHPSPHVHETLSLRPPLREPESGSPKAFSTFQ